MDITVKKENIVKAALTFNRLFNSNPSSVNFAVISSANGKSSLIGLNNGGFIRVYFDCEETQNGSVIVDRKKLIGIILKSQSENISISGFEDKVTIKRYDNNKFDFTEFHLENRNISNFPVVPFINPDQEVIIPYGIIEQAIANVEYAVSADDNVKSLTGILLNIENELLTVVATDRKRIARYRHIIEGINANLSINIVLKTEFVQMLKMVCENKNASKIKLQIDKNKIRAIIGNVALISEIIDNWFPNYRNAIPKCFPDSFCLNCHAFIDEINELKNYWIGNDRDRIKFKLRRNHLVLEAENKNGKKRAVLNIDYNGQPIDFVMNAVLFCEPLIKIGMEEVVFRFNNNSSAVYMELLGTDEKFDYTIMPIPENF